MAVWIREPGEKGHSGRGKKVELHVQDTRFGLNIMRRYSDRSTAETIMKAVELHVCLGEPEKVLNLLGGKQFGGPVQEPMPILGTWLDQRIAAWSETSETKDGICKASNRVYKNAAKHWASLGQTPLDRLTAQMITAVLTKLWSKYAQSTLGRIIGVMQMALEDAFFLGRIPVNPMPRTRALTRHLGRKRKKVPSTRAEVKTPVYTPEEVERLVEAAGRIPRVKAFERTFRKSGRIVRVSAIVRRAEKARRDTAFLLLGVDGGLREAEIAGLEIECVDFAMNFIVVMRQFSAFGEGPTKNRTVRYVHMSTLLAATLKAWIQELTALSGGNPGRWLFPSRNGNRIGDPVGPRAVYEAWRRTVRAAGVKYMKFHQTRHTFVSALVAEGATLQEVADQIGDTLATTERYYRHLIPAKNSAIPGKLDARRGRAQQARQQDADTRGSHPGSASSSVSPPTSVAPAPY